MAILRIYLLLVTGEAGLALGVLLWRQAADGTPRFAWIAASLLLFTGMAASAWLAYQALANPGWLDMASARLERLSHRQAALYCLLGTVFLSVLLTVAALAPLAPSPAADLILGLQADLSAFLPVTIWLGLAAAQLLGVIIILFPLTRRPLIKGVLLSGVLLLSVLLYWQGAVQQLEYVNDDLELNDQEAYMNFTRRLFESSYTDLGGFNRMPAYPGLQTLFYRPEMGDEDLFLQGKYANLILSILLLAGFGWFFFYTFRPLLALNLFLILAFLIFIFKAGFFQAELLFYFLNFWLFWCLWRLLQKPSWPIAILAGLLAGVAHLTKASILPGLILFLVFGLLQVSWKALRTRRSAQPGDGWRTVLSNSVLVLLVGVVFLVSVYPYLQYSKRLTGRYFYNVNSTFYLWYDSWQEARQGTRAYGDREGWPNMPADQIPSLSKYLREHSKRKILNRFVFGAQAVLDQVIRSYGYFKYMLIFAGLFILAVVFRWRRAWNWVAANPFLFLFFLAYFGIYFLLYFWYAPISAGNRLILGQLIPLTVLIALGWQNLMEDFNLNLRGRPIHVFTVINLAILILLAWDIYDVLAKRILILYGGD